MIPKAYILLAKAAFGIFLVLLLSGCVNSKEEVNRFFQSEEISIEVGKDVEILYSDSARVRVRIIAPTLLNHVDKINPRKEFPDGVEVEFYNQFKEVESRLTAKYALQFEKKKEIIVRDSVVLVSNNNERLESDELVWDEKDKIIYSNKFVSVKTDKEQFYGFGFEADQEFTKWKIIKPIGELEVSDIQSNLNR